MEITKKIVFIGLQFFGVATWLHAQNVYEGQRAGLIQTTGSIYPSVQLNTAGVNYYVGGHMMIHLDDHYSFRGDIYTLAGSKNKPSYINDHTQIQAGFTRNFPFKRLDPFVGLQVGVSMIETNARLGSNYHASFSLLEGVQFHVYKFFYFFAEIQYTHQQDPVYTRPLDQFMGTGGLGIQLPTKRVKG